MLLIVIPFNKKAYICSSIEFNMSIYPQKQYPANNTTFR